MAAKVDWDQIKNNLLVLKSIYHSVKSLLGPRKMLKCCISDSSDEGQLFNDTMRVLTCLDISTASFGLLYDISQAHNTCYGCGTTTLIVMSAFWSEEISHLLLEGLPLPTIMEGFQTALTVCSKTVQEHGMTMEELYHKFIVKLNKKQDYPQFGRACVVHKSTPFIQKTLPLSKNVNFMRVSTIPLTGYKNNHSVKSNISYYSRHLAGGNPSHASNRIVKKSQTNLSAVDGKSELDKQLFLGGDVHTSGEDGCVTRSSTVSVPPRHKDDVIHREGLPVCSARCPHYDFLVYLVDALCPARDEVVRRMAVLCMEHQCSGEVGTPGPNHFSKDRIFLDKATGPSKEHSQVHNNAIFVRIRSDFIHLLQRLRNPPKGLRVLTLNDTIAPDFVHKGMKPIKSVTEVHYLSSETGATVEGTTSWTQRVVETLLKLKIDILIARSFVANDVIVTCLSHDIVVLDNVEAKKLTCIAKLAKSEVLTYLYQADQDSVGMVKDISMVGVSGWENPRVRTPESTALQFESSHRVSYCKLSVDESFKVSSALLCSPSSQQVCLLDSDFNKCLNRLEQAFLPSPHLLQGGGWLETMCVDVLCRYRHSEDPNKHNMSMDEGMPAPFTMMDLREEIMRSCAAGLEGFLVTLETNTDKKPKCSRDCVSDTPCMSSLPKILDLGNLKLKVWKKAVDLARLFHVAHENRKRTYN